VLLNINFMTNSDNFIFDNQILAQTFYAGYEIAEITCPTKYFDDASSINMSRSIEYGFGVMLTSIKYFLQKVGLGNFRLFIKENDS